MFLTCHLPLKFYLWLCPYIVPLRLFEPTEIPIDLFIFHFCAPFALEQLDVRNGCLQLVKIWFTVVSKQLGLTEYLLPRPPRPPAAALPPAPEPGPADAAATTATTITTTAPTTAATTTTGDMSTRDSSDVPFSEAPSSPLFPPCSGGDAATDGTGIPDLDVTLPASSSFSSSSISSSSSSSSSLSSPPFSSSFAGSSLHSAGEGALPPSSTSTVSKEKKPLTTEEKEMQRIASFYDEFPPEPNHAADETSSSADREMKQIAGMYDEIAEQPVVQDSNFAATVEASRLLIERLAQLEAQDRANEARKRSNKSLVIRHFLLRIFALLVLQWLSHMVWVGLVVVSPLLTGRWLLQQMLLSRHDMYAFLAGFYFYAVILFVLMQLVPYLKNRSFERIASVVVQAVVLGGKCLLLGAFLFGLIPLLVGTLVDLALVVPLRVPLDESPCLLFYQDWALGLVLCKVWVRGALAGVGGTEK